jgi:hypothetical protein
VLAALLGGAPERARAYAAEAIETEGAGGEPAFWEWLEDLLNRPASGSAPGGPSMPSS